MKPFKKTLKDYIGILNWRRHLEFDDLIHDIVFADASAELNPQELPLDQFAVSASRDELWDYIQSVSREQDRMLEHVEHLKKFFAEDVKDERMWATKELLAGSRFMDYTELVRALDDFRRLLIYNHYAMETYECIHMPVIYAPPDILIKDPE